MFSSFFRRGLYRSSILSGAKNFSVATESSSSKTGGRGLKLSGLILMNLLYFGAADSTSHCESEQSKAVKAELNKLKSKTKDIVEDPERINSAVDSVMNSMNNASVIVQNAYRTGDIKAVSAPLQDKMQIIRSKSEETINTIREEISNGDNHSFFRHLLGNQPAEHLQMNLTLGAIAGFCSGFAVKKISKVAAFFVGAGYIVTQFAVYKKWIEPPNWDKVNATIIGALDVDGDGHLTGSDLKYYYDRFMSFLQYNIPGSASFTTAFLLGFKYT